jgi:hypothetical protein
MTLSLYTGNLNDESLTRPSSKPEQGVGQSCAEKWILKMAVYKINIQYSIDARQVQTTDNEVISAGW